MAVGIHCLPGWKVIRFCIRKMDKIRARLWFSVVVGIAYLFFGLMQVLSSIGVMPEISIFPADLMGGLLLIVISFVFLFGARELSFGEQEGVSYVYVGIVLSLIMMGIYVFIVLGNLLSAALVPILEDGPFEWDLISELRPVIFLGVLSLIGFYSWKDEFSKPMKLR
jgi:hypothetical protein